MARSKKISQLDENGTLKGTDLVPVSDKDGTSTFKLSMDDLVDYIDDNANFNPTIVSGIRTEDFSIDSSTTETIFVIDTNAGDITVQLSNHTQHINQQFIFKKWTSDGNKVFIQTGGGLDIDGLITYELTTQYQTLTIVGSNHGWLII